jgi:hypothetical protein
LEKDKQLSGIPFAVEQLKEGPFEGQVHNLIAHAHAHDFCSLKISIRYTYLHKANKIRIAQSSVLQREIKKTHLLPQSREPVALG